MYINHKLTFDNQLYVRIKNFSFILSYASNQLISISMADVETRLLNQKTRLEGIIPGIVAIRVLESEVAVYITHLWCPMHNNTPLYSGGRLNKKDGLTRYGDSHVKDKTS